MSPRFVRRHMILAIAAFLLGSASIQLPAADSDADAKKKEAAKLAGNWLGTIDAGVIKLRLAFVIQDAKDGKTGGKMISLDQGKSQLPVDEIQLTNDSVALTVKGNAGQFEGTWNHETNEIVGKWKQLGRSFPLTLKKVETLPDMARPQDPKKPYPYREPEVSFPNAKHNLTLKGTLTLPKGDGPFAAVVLISGSGPQDRNEELLGHRPFLILADALTRKGIAVLRFDDRDFGKADETFKATSEELSEDVMAAVTFLRSRPEINANKIGLLGHSEGGLIAPMLAAREKSIAFIVMIAGPAIPGQAILLSQAERLGKYAGQDEAKIQKDQAVFQKTYDIIKSEPDNEAAATKIEQLRQDSLDSGDKNQSEASKAIVKNQIKTLLSPWFRSFIAYDPRPALTKVTCPVLAVIGERDCQVASKKNLSATETALKEAGNRDFTVKELPGLNHLLQPCKTGMPDEYATIETTIDPAALKLITDWIVDRSTP